MKSTSRPNLDAGNCAAAISRQPRNLKALCIKEVHSMTLLLSQAGYGRRLGVTAAAISQWKKAGMLVMAGSMVDAEASDERVRRCRTEGLPLIPPQGTTVKRVPPGANSPALNAERMPMQLPCAEVKRRLQALDWRRIFDWSDAAQQERARLGALCVGWYAVTSDLRDDGHWGGFQVRTEVMDGGELNSNCIVGGYGYEFDCWDVLRACREGLIESFDGDEDVSVRADLLHWLAHPFSEHDRR
jgi:hypothetical protein